jgi:NADPH:quinone reductase-like Zn-dependent oxidoreductase
MSTTEVSASRTQREPQLTGQTVVLLGGSAGIGLETARLARAEGAEVILVGRNAERLDHAARDVDAQSTAAFDATDPDECLVLPGHKAVVVGHRIEPLQLPLRLQSLKRRSREELGSHGMGQGFHRPAGSTSRISSGRNGRSSTLSLKALRRW